MEDLEVSQNDVQAFNEGYLIGKHKPEILESLVENNKDNDYVQLMLKGKRQADKEKLVRQQVQNRNAQNTKRRR